MVGQIFADQIEVTIRHHALEAGCFVVNATGWLTPEQVAQISSDEKLQRVLSGGCNTAIIGPEGNHLCEPITAGEGMAIANLDFSLITKRKRMMDSVGHYARPEFLQLHLDQSVHAVITLDGKESKTSQGAKEIFSQELAIAEKDQPEDQPQAPASSVLPIFTPDS
jgi:aliphatic nitrilase